MTTDTRTTLNLPADMTRAIDNYWHAEQLRSRNEAIRELLRRALSTATTDQLAREHIRPLPTTDPHERDRVWNNKGVLTRSKPAKEQRR